MPILNIPGVVTGRVLPNQRSVKYFHRIYREALSGDAEAQWEIGCNFENYGVFPKNPDRAFEWFTRSAAHGYAPAIKRCTCTAHRKRGGKEHQGGD